jgi:hypothetical protein
MAFARAGVFAFEVLFAAGAGATVWATNTCGNTIVTPAANASDTAIFVKQFCFAIEELIGL